VHNVATNASPVGSYASTCSGAVDNNYSITYVAGVVTVKAASLTLNWIPAFPALTYGATLTPGTAPLNASVTGGVNGVFTYTAIPAGGGSPIVIGPGTVLPAGNYTFAVSFAPQDSTDYTAPTPVTAGALTVNQASPGTLNFVPNPSSVSYNVPLSSATLDASLMGADAGNGNITYAIGSSPLAAGAVLTAGSYTVIATFTPTGATANDYTTATASAQLTIKPAAPVLNWILAIPALTYGATLTPGTAPLNASVTGGVTGTFTYTATPIGGGSPIVIGPGTVLPAGSYTVTATFTPTGGTANDYTTATASAQLTINPAALTITASSASMVYLSAPPAITASYSTFSNNESAALLGTVVCATAATNASSVGTYASTCSGAVDNNYSITYVAGVVTVKAASLTLNWIPTLPALTYGATLTPGTAPLNASVTGGVTGTFTYPRPERRRIAHRHRTGHGVAGGQLHRDGYLHANRRDGERLHHGHGQRPVDHRSGGADDYREQRDDELRRNGAGDHGQLQRL